jgi:hypothetical protein
MTLLNTMPKIQKPDQQEFVLVERPYKKIAITFLVLAALLVGVISYFSLSRAVIVLVPKETEKSKNFLAQVPLNATSTATELNGNYGEKNLDIVKSFEVKNFKTEPGKARGNVTIINKHSKDQTLVATTRFLSPNNLLFRLKNSVTVPAGGEVTAEIEADEMGAKYEIAPTTFTIPGLSADLQKIIYGVSKEAMQGGVRKIGTLTAAEITETQKGVLATLDESIIKEINVDENKITLFEKEIKDEKISAKDGDTVEKFTVTIKVRVKIVTMEKEKILAWAKNQYQKSIEQNEEIKNFNLGAVTYALEAVTPTLAQIRVALSAFTLGAPNLLDFNKQKLYGLDAKGVRFYLTQFENIKDAEIMFSPFWVKTVPSLADHIEIRIKN